MIISVGNLAMGGTGKTPFTIMLAKHYMAAGERVAILSLGYKGALGYDVNIISDGVELFHTPPEAADEPYMMAESLLKYHNGVGAIVVTGKERKNSHAVAVERYNPSVFILDDGFQHKRMPRDVDIVLLDYSRPISTGFPVPFGYLREFPSALKRADIIVFTRATGVVVPTKVQKYCEGKPVFFTNTLYSCFASSSSKSFAIEELSGKSVWLMSGIAGNKQFARQVEALGANIVGHSEFGDHHHYTDDELSDVIKKAAKADIKITTQKDYVKLPEWAEKHFIYPQMEIKFLDNGDIFSAIASVEK